MAILNSFITDVPERIGTPSLYFFFFVAGLTLAAVLRQVHPDKGISNEATAILNSFIIFESIASRQVHPGAGISKATVILNSFVNDIVERTVMTIQRRTAASRTIGMQRATGP
ncbi:uncharacterized protein HD556DRAFT_1451127 [Suillus plorans]|uniref:Uncharacterized protein n=1 Tax=Suillus plorans TaxID=116603 RepID=A0A9P7D9D5_9AGAM|nr:uncharacterized protein HD556DRAFT_1451127 [Suillus plorans]KAG1785040.1 hypothetical protein HD556DRAFT_1451127 [Suillus plorans]